MLASGCGPQAAPAGAEPIVLGLPCSIGLPPAKEGEDCVKMAIEEINAAGGVNVGGTKRPFKLASIDTRDMMPGVPTAEALLAVKKLILEEKPFAFVVAPGRSEVLLASMDLNFEYKIPQIITAAKGPEIVAKVKENYDKYKYNFRVNADAMALVTYHVDIAQALGKKYGFNKVFTLQEDAAWAKGAGALIAQQLGKLGWQVVGSETAPIGTSEFSMALTKVKQSGAQVVIIFHSMPEAGNLISQWADMKIPVVPIGMVMALGEEKTWKTTNGTVEGLINHFPEAGAIAAANIPKSKVFYDNFTKKFGHSPIYMSPPSPSYDAVYVMKAAIEKAGKLDPDAVVTALEATDMDGAVGHITFDKVFHQAAYGYNPKTQALGLFAQWQQPGVRKVVFPLEVAEGDFVLPPWMRK
jgi:branched-chain amino acid transport system substrate-binding protein